MRIDCDRLWEVDALREGTLSAKDQASFSQHVRTCAACAGAVARDERLRELARAMPAQEPNELELRRRRSRILNDVATRPAPRRRGAVIAAVVAAALLVAWSSWALVHQRFLRAPTASLPAARVAASLPPAADEEPATRTLDPEPPAIFIDPAPVEREHRSRVVDSHPTAAGRDAGRGVATSSPKAPAASTEDDATDAYAAAVAIFHRGDYASASLAFRAFSQNYSREPQVEDATYLDAVALARAGRADAAGAAAEDHLARFPRSFHRREASILIARAARDRGDCVRARAVLAPWLAPTPDREAESTLRTCDEPRPNER
jgi:TolA-binding protein